MHPIVAELYAQLSLPLIAAPMFIVSTPELVIAQCAQGIVGSMPSLNARQAQDLTVWLERIDSALAQLKKQEPTRKIAPYAVNLIIHRSNPRVEHDLGVCAQHKVPIIITSLSAPHAVVDSVHAWGGKVFHDITTIRHAEKALEAGVDGLILVCNGAGGHAGTTNPLALTGEIRRFYDGPLILSGAISRGQDIAAALAMGADFAYMGTRFIASQQANATQEYQQAILDSSAKDVIYTPYFTGIPGNYLRASIERAGLNPEQLPQTKEIQISDSKSKPWKDIWGAGQGVGNIDTIDTVADIVQRLRTEYQDTLTRLQHIHPGSQT